jgi:predicted N-acetyltransferase YhbS
MSMSPTAVQPAALAPALRLERPEDAVRVDSLIERAFGPGRLAKAAERLREHNRPAPLSVVAWGADEIVGCVRLWPIHIGAAAALLLGPFAVEDAWRGRGLGSDLVERACEVARDAGHGLILLVGDAPFFSKLGFEMVPAGRVVLPGPVNPRRVMWRALQSGAADGVEGFARAGD